MCCASSPRRPLHADLSGKVGDKNSAKNDAHETDKSETSRHDKTLKDLIAEGDFEPNFYFVEWNTLPSPTMPLDNNNPEQHP